MTNFTSSIKQPVKFFEDLIIEKGYEEFRNEFFEQWEKNDPMGVYVRFYKEDDYVVHDFQIMFDNSEFLEPSEATGPPMHPPVVLKLYDEVSITDNLNDWKDYSIPPQKGVKKRVNLKDVLNYRINKELIISQKLISQAISEITFNNNSADIFLHQQIQIIQSLTFRDIWLFKEYPNCKSHLESISQYILGFTSKASKEVLSLIPDQMDETDNNPITNIIRYLKGKDENGLQILMEDDYNNLFHLLQKLIESKKCPEFENRFRFNIPIGVLKYTFYLLLPFIGTDENGKRDYYYHFLRKAFPQFGEKWSFESLKTKISVYPSFLPDYLPPIFREKKQLQINKHK